MVLANTEFPANEAKLESNSNTLSCEEREEVKPCSVDVIVQNDFIGSTTESVTKIEEASEKNGINTAARVSIFIFCVIALVVGRLGVPDEESPCVKDRVVDALQSVNDFINAPGNEFFRDLMQMICSLLLDIVFLVTFGYWVLYGKNARLPISMGIFYVVRALVQQVWVSPFPQGYYWEAPILPSLVVPYGRGSDFFFSGHSGFLVLCALELHKVKLTKMRNLAIGSLIYTIFILLSYRIHYSIDIFTGVIFAEWCYGKVELHQETVANIFNQGFKNVLSFFGNKYDKMILADQAVSENSHKDAKTVV